jgi:hypothetical protein
VGSHAAPTCQKEHGHTGCVTWLSCFFSYLLAIYASGRDACLVMGCSCLSSVETLALTGTLTDLTDLTDTLLSDVPMFHLPQIKFHKGCKLGPVDRWRLPGWMSGPRYAGSDPVSIPSQGGRRTVFISSPVPYPQWHMKYYDPHIARMIFRCLKSSLPRMAASGGFRGDGSSVPSMTSSWSGDTQGFSPRDSLLAVMGPVGARAFDGCKSSPFSSS